MADVKAQGPPPATDSGRGAVTDQPSSRVPAETLERPELRGAHELETPNFGPREAMPKPRPATYGSISEPRVPDPRRYVQSSPGVPPPPPPPPPARPSSRPRKTHQSATARSRARKRWTRGAGQPPAALAPDTCHVGRITQDNPDAMPRTAEGHGPQKPWVQVPRHSSWLLPLFFLSEGERSMQGAISVSRKFTTVLRR